MVTYTRIACIGLILAIIACTPVLAITKSDILANYQSQSTSKITVGFSGSEKISTIHEHVSVPNPTSSSNIIDLGNITAPSLTSPPYTPVGEVNYIQGLYPFSGNYYSGAIDDAGITFSMAEPVTFIASNTGFAALNTDISSGKKVILTGGRTEKEPILVKDRINQADIFNSSKYPETLYNPISKTITIRGSYGQATIFGDDSAMDVILTLQEAQEIAEQYARDRSSLFVTIDMHLRDAELLDHGDGGKEYQFIWVQKIGEVMTPNKVVVSINPETGGVTGFAEINKDITVTDLTPNVSAEEAKEIALKQFNPMVLTCPIETTLKIDFVGHDALRNNQKLLWEVRIMGDPINSTDCGRGGIVQIDAKTGEVLNIDPWM